MNGEHVVAYLLGAASMMLVILWGWRIVVSVLVDWAELTVAPVIWVVLHPIVWLVPVCTSLGWLLHGWWLMHDQEADR